MAGRVPIDLIGPIQSRELGSMISTGADRVGELARLEGQLPSDKAVHSALISIRQNNPHLYCAIPCTYVVKFLCEVVVGVPEVVLVDDLRQAWIGPWKCAPIQLFFLKFNDM